MQHCLTSLKVVKVGLHVKVNRRESYREHLATMFGCESNSWRAGSLRLRCDQRAGENSQSTKCSLTRASELLLILRERENMAAVNQLFLNRLEWTEEVQYRWVID